jgi:microsomal epoxide hydrolase
MPRGGHFPAMEQPELLINDIRDFARSLVKQKTKFGVNLA